MTNVAWVRNSKSQEVKSMADLDKRRTQIEDMLQYTDDEDNIFLHFAAIEERAKVALDVFEEDFRIADDFDYYMSDEVYSDEHLALVQEVEHRLLAMAAKLRNRRLNAVNKRIADLGTNEGNYLNMGAGI